MNSKVSLVKEIADKFFLRFHMSLMLSLTIISGYATTKLLYLSGVTNLTVRYSLSFIVSYLVFFLLIRVWLYYIFATRNHSNDSSWDLWDFDISIWSFPSSDKYKGGGGSFSGGGASGSFDDASSVAEEIKPEADAFSSLSEVADDSPIIIAFIVIGGVVITLGSMFFMVLNAPVLLGEIAFQLALSVGILKSAGRKAHPFSWLETAFSKTWKMALGLLILIVASTLTINHFYPQVTKASEVRIIVLEKLKK